MAGGQALAEILFGDVAPVGKLTISYPRHVGQQPIFYSQVRGQHGDRYADLTQEPLFRFGHGLSYTRFAYRDLVVRTPLSAAGRRWSWTSSSSTRAHASGTEIVQVYLSDLVTSVTWVEQALVAFARVTLDAGQAERVRLIVPFERLALVDAYERRLVEPGEFELRVGGTSDPSRLLRARFVVEGQAFSFEAIPGVARPAP